MAIFYMALKLQHNHRECLYYETSTLFSSFYFKYMNYSSSKFNLRQYLLLWSSAHLPV